MPVLVFFVTHCQVIFAEIWHGAKKGKHQGKKGERWKDRKNDKIKKEEKDRKIEKKTNKKKDRKNRIRQSNQSNRGLRSADYVDKAANKHKKNLARTCADTKGRMTE